MNSGNSPVSTSLLTRGAQGLTGGQLWCPALRAFWDMNSDAYVHVVLYILSNRPSPQTQFISFKYDFSNEG